MKQYLLANEAKRVGFPWPALSANSIGPVLARNAQPAIRDRVVAEILSGNVAPVPLLPVLVTAAWQRRVITAIGQGFGWPDLSCFYSQATRCAKISRH